MIALITSLAVLFMLAVADTIFTIALWVIHKIDKEETEEYEKRDL